MLSKIGGILIALGLLVGLPFSVTGLVIAVGVGCFGFALGNLGDEARRSREVADLRSLVPLGAPIDEVRKYVGDGTEFETESWLEELPWPPLPEEVEDTFFFRRKGAVARLGIVQGRVNCVSVLWKSDHFL